MIIKYNFEAPFLAPNDIKKKKIKRITKNEKRNETQNENENVQGGAINNYKLLSLSPKLNAKCC